MLNLSKSEDAKANIRLESVGLSIVKNVFESSGYVVDVVMTEDKFGIIAKK